MNKNQPENKGFWRKMIAFSLFLYFFALFFAPEDVIGGYPFYKWCKWLSYVLLTGGATVGTLQVVSRRKQMAESLKSSQTSEENSKADQEGAVVVQETAVANQKSIVAVQETAITKPGTAAA